MWLCPPYQVSWDCGAPPGAALSLGHVPSTTAAGMVRICSQIELAPLMGSGAYSNLPLLDSVGIHGAGPEAVPLGSVYTMLLCC